LLRFQDYILFILAETKKDVWLFYSNDEQLL